MASLFAGAGRRAQIVSGWHNAYVQAEKQGQQCSLQPNKVYNPGHTVQLPVPDMKVCGYFLRTDNPAKARDTAVVVKRLQQAGVVVYRLAKPLYVKDFAAYGRARAAATMPAGTYWIPMAQAEKHWIQAMLNENTYVPFPYFYDVSGWSMALLSNLDGGYTGLSLKPLSTVLPPVRVPAVKLPSGLPRVGILSYTSSPFQPSESAGWLRWRLDHDWRIPSTVLSPSQVTPSVLSHLDTLLVPDTDAKTVTTLLGATGKKALADWTNGGGHYVGWEGGAQLAAGLGLSTAVLRDPKGTAPGTLFRVNTPNAGTNWVMYNSDPVMTASNPANVVASYPALTSPDWYVSGYQQGEEELAGTAAEISEPAGSGQVTVFAVDPNFRAFSDGSAHLLFDALLASRGTAKAQPYVNSGQRSAAELRAEQSAAAMTRTYGASLVLRVRPADATAAGQVQVLRGHGVTYRTVTGPGFVQLSSSTRAGTRPPIRPHGSARCRPNWPPPPAPPRRSPSRLPELLERFAREGLRIEVGVLRSRSKVKGRDRRSGAKVRGEGQGRRSRSKAAVASEEREDPGSSGVDRVGWGFVRGYGHLALLCDDVGWFCALFVAFPERFSGCRSSSAGLCAPLDVECGLLYRTRPPTCDSWD
ncbi:hypothetical protein [Fodinicola feengrottensis]|uniref:hypothetical protein n=1 Tax=Fodinicola feengrottensis TaxID=435914 RepID=UPI0013D264E8|nr:hypothetical protein [Fodinicola feengrottensis]